jgi:hypothetical protein
LALLSVEFIAVFTMAQEYPTTIVAPLLAVGCIAALNTLVLATAPHPWNVVLQIVAIAILVTSSYVALVPTVGISEGARASAVAIGTIAIVALAWARVPCRPLRYSLLAQQTAASVTLLSWLATEPFRISGEMEEMLSFPHFHAGMRALFAAPLLLGCVVALGGLSKTRTQAMMLGSICSGQLGIGLMELGWAMKNHVVTYLGIAAGVGMILLLFVARSRHRAEAATSA